MPSEADARTERLHPISLVFGIGTAARNLLFPAVLVLVSSSVNRYDSWFALLFVPAVAHYLVKYLSYRYHLGPDEMVIREGLLTRNERHIPYARIQNIDLVQNPVHRLFGVAVVRLETASGGRPEAVIRVLSLEQVEQMRAHVFEGRGASTDARSGDPAAAALPAPAGHSLLALPLRELVIYGLISNRGLVVVAAAIGLVSQGNWFDFDLSSRIERLVRGASNGASLAPPGALGGGVLALAVWGAGLLVAIVLVMRVLSVGLAVVRLYGFDLRLRGEDLGAAYGLLTRVTATVPRHRIQLLSTQATWLHRRFGRVSVYVETAGGGGEEEGRGAVTERQWLAPVLPTARVNALVREVLPEIDLDTVEWRPLEPRARGRLFRRALVRLAVLAVFGLPLVGWWSLWILPLGAPLAWFHARRWMATAGWALTEHAALFRSGWWNRRLSLVRYGKIQTLALTQSPFDRRARMAAVSVDTAGAGRVGHRVRIPFLDVPTAHAVLDRLYAEAGRVAFRWR